MIKSKEMKLYQFLKFKIDPILKYTLNYSNVELNHNNDEFDEIREMLNSRKTLLDSIPEKTYSYISQNLDSYRNLRTLLALHYSMQVVTNATIKIYEIITQMDIIKKNDISVFCNAELPGNFIIGINHYLKTIYKTSTFKWVASSYINNKGTLGDTYGIYKCNKNNWLMDENMDGDITNKINVINLSEKVLSRFPNGVDLYTGDAGFDVSNDYNKQEEQTILLNYGQVLCGLFTLSIGGSMITKQFTYFTPFNKSLIMLLTTLFKQLYITKPSTSRPLNSEVYIIGIGFKGINDQLKLYLLNRMSDIDPDIPLIIYSSNEYLVNSASEIYFNQIDYIECAYKIYNEKKKIKTEDYNQLHKDWLFYNPIFNIDKNDYLPYYKK